MTLPDPGSRPGWLEIPGHIAEEDEMPMSWLIKDKDGNRIDHPTLRIEHVEGKRYLVVEELEEPMPDGDTPVRP